MLDLIKLALWGTGTAKANREIYEEMQAQAISMLPAQVLSRLSLPNDLCNEWRASIMKQLFFYEKYKHLQDNLPITVPYVILKGTSAARYYPFPEYRTMGDIDIMTRHEDFDKALNELVEAGYKVEKNLDREIGLIKNGIIVELHKYFATLEDPQKAKYMDELIISNIDSSHELPDMINGLVLLEHISQHLENGLGIRQIIDWMLFVNKCLSDKEWPEFQVLADNIGLRTLAIVTTKMCELYLGLPQRKWCSGADETLCNQLLDYVVSCGNFGYKKTSDSEITENVFAYAKTFKEAMKLFQARGLVNWKAAQKHRVLRPLAWLYQAFRYFSRGIKQKNAFSQLMTEYKAARQRNIMLDELKVRQESKGIAIYREGEYVKK